MSGSHLAEALTPNLLRNLAAYPGSATLVQAAAIVC